jgi:cytochrome c
VAVVKRVWLAWALVTLGSAGLLGCEPQRPPSAAAAAPAASSARPAAGFDAGPVRTAPEYLADPSFAVADLARGELLSLACAACHTFRAGQGTLVGPNLHGVFGRSAASVPGFAYSPALQAAQLVWTPVSLEAWLTEPAGFVVGTTMAFSGYRSADDRRDLIAYLLSATQ